MTRRDGGAPKSSKADRKRAKKRISPRRRKHLLQFDSNRVKGLCRRLVTNLAAFLSMTIAPNAVYGPEDVAMALAYASCNKLFLEGTAARLNAGGLAPSADRLVDLVERIGWKDLLVAYRRARDRLLARAERGGKLPEKVILAVDMHRVARYRRPEGKYKGKRKAKDPPMAVAGKSVAGTNLAHQFATIEVMGKEPRLTLEVVPWFHGSSYRKTIKELLASARRWVRVSLLLMDREFFNVGSVEAVMKARAHFLMPAKKNAIVKRAMKKCRGLTHLVEPYEMGARIVNLIVVDREEIGKGQGHWAFLTDLPGEAWRELSELYAKRWGIETGYRDKKAFRARTCSLSYEVRLALFLVSVLAATIWTMERDSAPISWWDTMPAHLVRLALELYVLAHYAPQLLEWALAVAAGAALD